MRRLLLVTAVLAVLTPSAAALAGGSPPARTASFVSAIEVHGKQAQLTVRYRCATGEHLWVSAKETRSGVAASALTKEGSSRVAAAWWDSHRNRVTCDGRSRTSAFRIDTVEKARKGTLVPGRAWVQFCVTKGKSERDAELTLSVSGWVRVTAPM